MATKGELTLSTLKENTGITDNQLDMRIAYEHCRRLAGSFGSCVKYIDTPGLRLRPGQIADVKDYASQHGNEAAMTKALRCWLDNNPYRTYRQLIEILLELKEGRLVHDIVTIIIEIYHENEEQADEIIVMSLSRQQSGDISSKVNHFQKRFSELIKSTLMHLTETKSSLQEIKYSLLALPLPIRNEHDKLLLSRYSMVEEAKTVGEIFAIINSYLSFIDYNLLKYIIETFGSESLKTRMKLYARDMKQFRANTKITSIIPHLPRRSDLIFTNFPQRSDLQKGFSKLKTKLNFDPDTMTLEDLDEHRKQLASEFLLSDFALLMTQISEGSVHVEWLIPKSVVSFLKQSMKDKPDSTILKLQILRLSIDENVLYPPMTTEEFEELTSELHGTIRHQMERQGKLAQLAIPTGFQVEKIRTLKQTVQEIQQEFDKIKINFQKVLKDQNTESWLVPPEDISYPDCPKFTSTQNNAITTDGTFKGTPVAVKRLNLEISKPEDEDAILNEIHILTQIRHPNIVQFIAATLNTQIGYIIVTELLETSLDSVYYAYKTEQVREIQSILKDVAQALDYLHCHKEPIIHRDVRPANIYLVSRVSDRHMSPWTAKFHQHMSTQTAKLSGFGSAIFAKDASNLSPNADTEETVLPHKFYKKTKNTEYDAPEPSQSTTTKSDVYSFGMLMRRVSDHTFSHSLVDYDTDPNQPITLSSSFKSSRHSKRQDDIFSSCTHSSPDRRPTMNQVLECLKWSS